MGCITSKCRPVVEPKIKVTSQFEIKKVMSARRIEKILNSSQFKNHIWGFENLVIEGAGTNGTVTVGAYKILESVGILQDVRQIIGSSSGSILAAFAAVKIPASVVEDVFLRFDMNEIKDDSFGVFRDLSRITNQYGYYKGDALEMFVENILVANTGIPYITFQQVKNRYNKKLYITRANISTLQTEYLSADTYPDMPVSVAVRHSASIPLIFKAPISVAGDIIADGALGAPYPIDFFDNNHNSTMLNSGHAKNSNSTMLNSEHVRNCDYNNKTLGLKIMDPTLEKRNELIRTDLGYKITNLFEYVEALITFQTITIERLAIRAGYWERTITLESPCRRISDFDVSLKSKKNEIHQGSVDTVIALARYVDDGKF